MQARPKSIRDIRRPSLPADHPPAGRFVVAVHFGIKQSKTLHPDIAKDERENSKCHQEEPFRKESHTIAIRMTFGGSTGQRPRIQHFSGSYIHFRYQILIQ